MLCLSQSVGYAIQALTCFPDDGKSRLVREVAEEAKVPAAYLAKLVKRLADAKVVISRRGIKGGTWLSRPAKDITLMQISEAIDGKKWLGKCLMGLKECDDDRACPTHEFWKVARAQIEEKLNGTSLADVMAFEKARLAELLAMTPPVPPTCCNGDHSCNGENNGGEQHHASAPETCENAPSGDAPAHQDGQGCCGGEHHHHQ